MLNNYIAKRLYITGGKILGDNVDFHLRELQKSQWLPREKLEKLQLDKFVGLINHAYKFSPFYRSKFDASGVHPAEIKSHNDFKKLPILTKSELRKHYKEIVVTNGHYRYTMAKSSGSTGQAVKFFKDRQASGSGRGAMYRGHSWYGLDLGAREARLWGVPLDIKGRLISKLGDFLLNRFRAGSFELNEQVMLNFYKSICRKSPEYLMGYSSLVYEFAYFLGVKGIKAASLGLKMVKVTAETLFDYQREVIESVFRCPVVLEYGAAEVGIIAFECPEHGLHIASEGVLVEELEDSGYDDLQELLITDLDNYYFPIIRYRLGDFGRLSSQSCVCGRESQLLAAVHGRTSDIAYRSDGSPVHSSIFSYLLKDVISRGGGIKQYKVYQNRKGSFDIFVVKGKEFSENTEKYLKDKIVDFFGKDTEVSIQYIDKIKREKSGKLRYFVSGL